MESVHWSKLKIPDVPLESPQRSEPVAIENTTFCFDIGMSLIWFVRFVAKFYCKAKPNTTSTEISYKNAPSIKLKKSIPNAAIKISYKIAYSCCSVASTGSEESRDLFLILILVEQIITS